MFLSVTDVAGEVVELGEDVKNFKVGDKVVAMLSYGVSALIPFSSVRHFLA